MPVVYPTELIEIVANWQLANGTPGNNVLHARTAAPGDPDLAAVQAAADWFAEWFDTGGTGSAGKGFFNANTTLVSVSATAPGLVVPIVATTPVNIPGQAAGVASPNESAIVATHYTGLVGKSYRGRTFFPGYDPDTLDNTGKLNTATLANWQAAVTNLIQGYVTQADVSLNPCVWSRHLNVLNSITTSVVRALPHHISRRNR